MKKLLRGLFIFATFCFCFIEAPSISEAKSAECIYRYDYAFEVLDYLNQERAKAGLSPLKMDQSLTDAAMLRASELPVKFDHYRPNGSYYSSVGNTSWLKAENIASLWKSPKAVNTAWTNSPSHYANMTGNFTGVGIGCIQTADGYLYWTEEFGVYRSSAKQKSNYSTISAKSLTTKISKIENKASGVKLTWESTLNADGYIIYRKQSDGSYKKLKKISNPSKNTYKDTDVKNGKKYSYKVLPYTKHDGKTGKCQAKTIIFQKRPTISSVSCNDCGEVTVKWKKVSGVSGYCVIYSNDPSFANTNFKYTGKSKSSITIDNVPSGWDTVYVKVCSYVKIKKDIVSSSPNSKTLSIKMKRRELSAPVVKSAVSDAAGKATVSWEPVEGADEYRVYFSKDKNFDDTLYYYSVKKERTSYTFSNLSSGKTYYFKAAAISNADDKTIKSNYSNIVSAKIQ